jgi:hypothetical protein
VVVRCGRLRHRGRARRADLKEGPDRASRGAGGRALQVHCEKVAYRAAAAEWPVPARSPNVTSRQQRTFVDDGFRAGLLAPDAPGCGRLLPGL